MWIVSPVYVDPFLIRRALGREYETGVCLLVRGIRPYPGSFIFINLLVIIATPSTGAVQEKHERQRSSSIVRLGNKQSVRHGITSRSLKDVVGKVAVVVSAGNRNP